MVRGGHLGRRRKSQTAELNCPSRVQSIVAVDHKYKLVELVRFLPPARCASLHGTTSLAISVRTFLPMLPYALAAVLGSTDKKNVYGDELVTCSTDGMAMTGFTRDGFCTECADGAIEPTCCAHRVICTTAPTPSPQHRRRCRLAPHMHHHVAQRRGPPRGRQLLRADWARNATE